MNRDLKLLDATGCCAPGAPAMPVDAARALAERFKALADPTRLAIVNQLAGADEVCVCHLVPDSGLSQPTISHHLKLLRDAGLVRSERRGTWAYYRLVPEAVAELANALGAHTATPTAAIVAAS
jgi:ArsR family transcriptional regulator